MNPFENVTLEQIKNEVENMEPENWPSPNERRAFEDGFLAGMIWWKPILVKDYVGPKSDLQILCRNAMNSEIENMVSENQLEFDFEKFTKSVLRNV